MILIFFKDNKLTNIQHETIQLHISQTLFVYLGEFITVVFVLFWKIVTYIYSIFVNK